MRIQPLARCLALAGLAAGVTAHANPAWPGMPYPGNQTPPDNLVTWIQGKGSILTGLTDVYLIYYGDWTQTYHYNPDNADHSAATDQSIINDYVRNLGASAHFKILETYFDPNNRHPSGVRLAGTWSVPDTSTYGTTLYNDSATHTFQDLVHDQIEAHNAEIVRPDSSVFIVLSAPGVQVAGSGACGFHDSLGDAWLGDLDGFTYRPVYASATFGPCSIAGENPSVVGGAIFPNSPVADLEVNELTHELFEAITDPMPNKGGSAWYAVGAGEIADVCGPFGAYLGLSGFPGESAFGPTYAPAYAPGRQATIRVGSRDFLVQREWVNDDGGYCAFRVRANGDFDGDGRADLVNFATAGLVPADANVYLARSQGDASFLTGTLGISYTGYTTQSGVRTFAADVNGNGITGLLTLGVSSPAGSLPAASGQWTIPGSWLVTALAGNFSTFSNGAKVVVGDWNGDGRTDLAALGTSTIRESFSLGNGSFSGTTSVSAPQAGGMLQAPYLLSGDFNRDGYDDFVATGAAGWTTTALSNGDGTFSFVSTTSSWNDYAGQPGAKIVAGDFNGDGFTDLLATGASTFGDNVIIGLGQPDGTFRVSKWSSNFNTYSTLSGVRLLSGDYDGDGTCDLTAYGPGLPSTIPVAFSRRFLGAFYLTTPANLPSSFASHSSLSHTATLSSWY